MHIKWPNLIAAGLVLVGLVVFLENPGAVGRFVGAVRHIGPQATAEEQVEGLISAAIIIVACLAALRIVLHAISHHQDDRHKHQK